MCILYNFVELLSFQFGSHHWSLAFLPAEGGVPSLDEFCFFSNLYSLRALKIHSNIIRVSLSLTPKQPSWKFTTFTTFLRFYLISSEASRSLKCSTYLSLNFFYVHIHTCSLKLVAQVKNFMARQYELRNSKANIESFDKIKHSNPGLLKSTLLLVDKLSDIYKHLNREHFNYTMPITKQINTKYTRGWVILCSSSSCCICLRSLCRVACITQLSEAAPTFTATSWHSVM